MLMPCVHMCPRSDIHELKYSQDLHRWQTAWETDPEEPLAAASLPRPFDASQALASALPCQKPSQATMPKTGT